MTKALCFVHSCAAVKRASGGGTGRVAPRRAPPPPPLRALRSSASPRMAAPPRSADDDGERLSLASLRGKRVLVTGSSGGLGAGIAVEFARQGCDVAVHYFTRRQGAEKTVERCSAAGAGKVVVHGADLRSEAALDALFDDVVADLGGVDVLVNNAGVVLKSSAEHCTAALFDDAFAVNVRAAYLLMRRAALRWRQGGSSGVIINNSSIHGTHGAVEWMSTYAMTKSALNALTQSLAWEWAPHVRVVSIAPGVVPVERTAEALYSEQSQRQWMPHFATGSYGGVEDIARMTVFLASDAAKWITGSVVSVDGGMTARMNMPQRGAPPPPGMPSPVQHPK